MESEEFELMAAAEDHMWWFRGLHGWLLDRISSLRLATPAAVLDCGAGTGGFTRKLARRHPDYHIVALDVDERAVRFFRERNAQPLVRGSVNSLPFPNAGFDLIVGADLLYHRAVSEQIAIAEIHRCLKPGGSVLLNLPAYGWMRSTHDVRVHTARRYTAASAAHAMNAGGFRIRESTYRNSLLFPIMALWRLTFGRVSKDSDVNDFPAWQETLFGLVIGFENRLARAGVRFPFGGSVYVHAVKD